MTDKPDSIVNIEKIMEDIRRARLARKGAPAEKKVPIEAGFPDRLQSTASSPLLEHMQILLPRYLHDDTFQIKNDYNAADFLYYHDASFVRFAYQGILRREPDAAGFDHFLAALRSGSLTRIEVLGRLRYSREGKGVKVRINGLLLRFIFHAFCRLPVVGPFAAWVKCWLKLPTAIRTIQRNEGAAVAGFSDLGRHMDNLAASLEDQLSMLQNLQSEIMDKRLAVVRQILEMHGRQNEGMEHQIADMKNGLDEQHKQTLSIQKHQEESIEPEIAEILIKIREHENHINDHRQHLSVLLTGDGHVLDAMYASFEDQFRGTRDEIKRRLSVYLPFIEPFKTATGRAQFLDVGCGRGEWLELLKENGYSATGVDLNSVMVQQCRDLGFDTVECDAIEYLGSQELNSLAAITAFHFIEHLPFNALIAFLDSALKSLKPGGIFIIETPNPQNILVGSCNFYLDPTHIKPLPAAAMKFIVETRGFDEVQILPLNPYPETFFLSGSELAERFNKLFYGPQDYAVMGRKKP